MCPRYILSDNGTEFKNQLMDQVLQQLSIDHIFSLPYHPQNNSKLEVFHKYLKPTPKKLCEKDPQNLATVETPFFSCLWQRYKPTIPSPSRTNAMLPRQSRIWTTQPRSPFTQPSYCKENVRWEPLQDCPENHGQRTIFFQIGQQSTLKNKQPRKWDPKWRPRCWIVHIEHDWHYLHIKNQAMGKTRSCNIKDIVLEPSIEFWNISMQFGKARKYINHPANLPTITQQLKMNTSLM